jgi:hypothetical protein
VFLDESFNEACNPEQAEELLGEMVERGGSVEDVVVVAPDIAEAAASRAERAFLGRRAAAVELERVENDAFVEKRMASLRNYYVKAMQKKRGLLERAISERKQERYQRMLRGMLTKLEAEFEVKTERLEKLRSVSAEHQQVALGIVEVTSPASRVDGNRARSN